MRFADSLGIAINSLVNSMMRDFIGCLSVSSIAIGIGVFAILLGFNKIAYFKRNEDKRRVWHNKWRKLLKFLGFVLVIFGILKFFLCASALAEEKFIWKKYDFEEFNYSIDFPAEPKKEVVNQPFLEWGSLTIYKNSVSLNNDKNYYVVSYNIVSEGAGIIKTYDAIIKSFEASGEDKLLYNKDIVINDCSAREAKFSHGEYIMRIRLLLHEDRLYRVLAVVPKDEGDDKHATLRFMRSFKLINVKRALGIPIEMNYGEKVSIAGTNMSIRFLKALTAHSDTGDFSDAHFVINYNGDQKEIHMKSVSGQPDKKVIGNYEITLKYADAYSQSCSIIVNKI
ncbi:MAG: hypothetical protein AB1755_03910 [Candidatus Omnitrophota bacterium]